MTFLSGLKALSKEDMLVLFAASAPPMSESYIQLQQNSDRNRNPHNDSYKPKLRSRDEIIADYRVEFAETQLKAFEASCRSY